MRFQCSQRWKQVLVQSWQLALFVYLYCFNRWVYLPAEPKKQSIKIGHFNQASLEDIPVIYDNERLNSTNSYNVLEAMRKDGYNPVPVSLPISSHEIRTDWYEKRQIAEPPSAFVVPNVVHYVLMGHDLKFTFVNYLSFLGVERFIKPEQIFVHGDVLPKGRWWNLTVRHVKNIYYVKRPYMDTAPNGQPLKYSAHASDYIRAEVLLRYGGIYLDADVLVLKSFDPLRKYTTVLGRETNFGVCNGIIVAARGAPFMKVILEQYLDYRGSEEDWASLSVENLHRLAQLLPHLVHIEETSLNRPNWMERVHVYHHNYDWSHNYAVHLFIRGWLDVFRPSGFEDVLHSDSTFGEMARAIIFGSDRSNRNVSLSTTRPLLVGLLLQL